MNLHPYHCVLCGTQLHETGLGILGCSGCSNQYISTVDENADEASLSWKASAEITKTYESGIDVGNTTSGNVHVSVFHGEHRFRIFIDPDHATRVAERLWDCAATGRAVQMENQPQDSIP